MLQEGSNVTNWCIDGSCQAPSHPLLRVGERYPTGRAQVKSETADSGRGPYERQQITCQVTPQLSAAAGIKHM